jgi:anti-anti-sigma factor
MGKSVRLGAIVVVGATGEIERPDAARPRLLKDPGKNFLVDQPLACVEIVGRSMTERLIERFLSAGVEIVSVLIASEGYQPKFRTSFDEDKVEIECVQDVPAAIRQKIKALNDAGIDHAFLNSADVYAETDFLDLFYFHREARQAVTSSFDRHGALALWVVDCNKAQDPNLEISLDQSRSSAASYFIREYVNRLNHPRDLRQFAEDTLRGRCESRPSGQQVRPGVWMDDKAEVHRRARIVAPAYIGRGAEIKADAVVTRFSNIEKDSCVDCGTVIEDSSILENTNIGIWLDVCHAVVSGNKLLSLGRDVTVEISDVSVMRLRSGSSNNSGKRARNKDKVGSGSSKNATSGGSKKEQSKPLMWQSDAVFPGAGKMSSKGPVIIMELPEQLKQAQVKEFMSELRPLFESARPCIVLDCSKIQDIDSAGVEMLLDCLDTAMKRDGDLKLAAVSPASAIVLELMRVDRLFEVFDTTDEATRSFQVFAPAAAPQTQPWYSSRYGLADLKTAN